MLLVLLGVDLSLADLSGRGDVDFDLLLPVLLEEEAVGVSRRDDKEEEEEPVDGCGFEVAESGCDFEELAVVVILGLLREEV